jgi:hypothetical protein
VRALDSPEKTRVVIEPWSESPRYLPERATIRFIFGDVESRDYIDVELRSPFTVTREKGNALSLSGSEGLVVRPDCANRVYVEIRRLEDGGK